MKTTTKMMCTLFIGVIAILVLLGGMHLFTMETEDNVVIVSGLFMMIEGLLTAIVCIAYNFIIAFDKEYDKQDKAERKIQNNDIPTAEVEEVN